MMDFETSKKRDAHLRRRVLMVLQNATRYSLTGMLTARDVVRDAEELARDGWGFESDSHAIGLFRDLVAKEMVQEHVGTRRHGQGFGLDLLKYRILDKGLDLLRENLPVDPDVEDERIAD